MGDLIDNLNEGSKVPNETSLVEQAGGLAGTVVEGVVKTVLTPVVGAEAAKEVVKFAGRLGHDVVEGMVKLFIGGRNVVLFPRGPGAIPPTKFDAFVASKMPTNVWLTRTLENVPDTWHRG